MITITIRKAAAVAHCKNAGYNLSGTTVLQNDL
jgi:hypothetical protein